MAIALLRPKRLLPPSSFNTNININIPSIFFQLPASYRSFHASPRPQFIETSVATAHTLLETLHSSTGLPWVYTIPLASLAIRASIILPLSIYARRVTQKQASLAPLIQSWQQVLHHETMKEAAHMGPQIVQRKMLWRIRQKRSELYKRWGCPVWKTMLPLVQLPVWLTAIEAVRAMCGAQSGLLGMVLRSDNDADAISAGIVKEASFATEGALWFPDLLVPDPQLILPFMLSGAVLLNLSSVKSGPNQALWQKRVKRSMKVVALALGPLTLQLPSAMLIYWISSSLLALIQAKVLDWAMPLPTPVKPCDPKKRWAVIKEAKGNSK